MADLNRRVAALHTGLVAVLLLAPMAGAGTWWWPTQGDWVETQHITASDADEPGARGLPSHWGMDFGSAIALDDDLMAISNQLTARDDDGGLEDGGDWIYLFERSQTGEWQEVAKLVPPDAQPGDAFGFSVALDAEARTVVAGNPAAQKIHIFEEVQDERWEQTASYVRPQDDCLPGCFGYDVGVSGTTAAAGVGTDLFLFERTHDSWSPAGTIPGGIHVAIEGMTLATMLINETADQPDYRIYTHDDGSWTVSEDILTSQIAADQGENTAPARIALSEDGGTLVISLPVDRRVQGVPTEWTGVDVGAIGSVWIFEKDEGGWVQTADLANPDPAPGERFGHAVAVTDELVAIGAPSDFHNGGENVGSAYVYRKSSGAWQYEAKLRNHDASGGDFYGDAVGASGTTVVVGATWDDNRRDGIPYPLDDEGDIPSAGDEGENAGSAYVYQQWDRNLAAGSEPIGLNGQGGGVR